MSKTFRNLKFPDDIPVYRPASNADELNKEALAAIEKKQKAFEKGKTLLGAMVFYITAEDGKNIAHHYRVAGKRLTLKTTVKEIIKLAEQDLEKERKERLQSEGRRK